MGYLEAHLEGDTPTPIFRCSPSKSCVINVVVSISLVWLLPPKLVMVPPQKAIVSRGSPAWPQSVCLPASLTCHSHLCVCSHHVHVIVTAIGSLVWFGSSGLCLWPGVENPGTLYVPNWAGLKMTGHWMGLKMGVVHYLGYWQILQKCNCL